MNLKLNFVRKRKKKGFTLIELMCVLGVIVMMVSVMLPKFKSYITEAKKLKVIDQSRKVVMAAETYNVKSIAEIDENKTVKQLIELEKGINNYLDQNDLKNLDIGSITLKQCYTILEGGEFKFKDKTEILDSSSISQKNENKIEGAETK